MQYTIKDIARLAGVSRGTVDRIIHKRGPVAKATFDKVTSVLNEINYKPNLVGRSLKKNKKFRIAVFIPDHKVVKYWEEVVIGIKKGAEEFEAFGITIEETYYSSDQSKIFKEQAQIILNSKPDAVLVAPILSKESVSFIEECKNNKIRVVYINTPLADVKSAFYIGTQRKLSGRVAANLFHNFRETSKILILNVKVGIENSIHMERKEKGFRDYFKEVSVENQIIESVSISKDSNKLEEIVKEFVLSDNKRKGIFVSGSHVHIIAKIIKENKLSAFLVGYDLISENITYLEQGLIQFLIHEKRMNQGYLGIKYLSEYFLFDKEMNSNTYLPVDIVNSENYKMYLKLP